MYYVYVLENTENGLYYGSTNDLKRRLKEHQSGKVFSTKSKSWTLIYYEAYASEIDARTREQRLKMDGRAIRQLKDRLRNSRRHES